MTEHTKETANSPSIAGQDSVKSSPIVVERAQSEEDLAKVFHIRKRVFVEEQHVREQDEYDAFEKQAHHYIATIEANPCGAARWRITGEGVKLERFAVLPEFRRKGVGGALLQAVLKDVEEQAGRRPIYLHAQLGALPLYEKFGFRKSGPMFEECGIRHFKMIK